MYDKQIDTLITCIEMLSETPALNDTEKKSLSQAVIDTLSNYPKPSEKADTKQPERLELGAFLLTSTVRNTAKLICLGYMEFDKEFLHIVSKLDLAFSLLTQSE